MAFSLLTVWSFELLRDIPYRQLRRTALKSPQLYLKVQYVETEY